MSSMKRIALTTGGGDAPGLNAVIRATVISALRRGWEVYGIRDGYDGLLFPEKFADGGLVPLDRESVRGITHLGGTILGTTNRGNPFSYPFEHPDGRREVKDLSDRLVMAARTHELDGIVAIGGDGSMAIARDLNQLGLRMIGVPKTIDNDLDGTVVTFGFDTAVAFASQCLDRLHSTAEAHRRVMVVEVMGRYAGWIALYAGVAGTADAILIPEIPFDIVKVAEKINQRFQRGRRFAIVIVAEGARPMSGERVVLTEEHGLPERLGGIGQQVADELAAISGRESRAVVLAHLLRGGTPTAYDRLIALRFGSAAVRALDNGLSGIMVALDPPTVRYVPLDEATRRMKSVPLDGDTILTARDLGIAFGD